MNVYDFEHNLDARLEEMEAGCYGDAVPFLVAAVRHFRGLVETVKQQAADLIRNADEYEGLYNYGGPDNPDAGIRLGNVADAILRLPEMPKRKDWE